MKITLIWVDSMTPFETPWLIGGWDEYTMEENFEGFEEEHQKALKDYGERVRLMVVEIPSIAVDALFKTPTVEGKVIE